MLAVEHLVKSFGGVRAVDDCSFTAAAGQITALIGPNGAGKTTVFNLITGVVRPDAGGVRLGDQPLDHLPVYARARAGLARTFQAVRTFRHLTVEDHGRLALAADDGVLWRSLLERRPSEEQRRVQRERISRMLAQVGLDVPLGTRASDLSYGQAKLLELARCLLQPHRVLLLDEPVAGVAPPLRESLVATLEQLRAQGETILLIEHDMDFVARTADTVVVLVAGRVLRQGTAAAIRRDPEVLEAYLGEVF